MSTDNCLVGLMRFVASLAIQESTRFNIQNAACLLIVFEKELKLTVIRWRFILLKNCQRLCGTDVCLLKVHKFGSHISLAVDGDIGRLDLFVLFSDSSLTVFSCTQLVKKAILSN